MKSSLITIINNKSAKVGVIGLGYVGLPLAIRFAEEGFKAIGFDIDSNKIDKLNNGKTYIKHIDDKKIKAANKLGFFATLDFSQICDVDVIIICVPTPIGIHNEPDLSYIHSTIDAIMPNLKKGQLLILESTTYPGTTDQEILPKIEDKGFCVGQDFFIGYSPEREDPGNKTFNTKTIPKIVSGSTKECLEIVQCLYGLIVDSIVPVSSTRVAEMTKILENIHRAVNIGLVNELKMVTEKLDIDIYEVINAAATKPFGFTPYYPGPGLGGHCIPIDPFYLTWKAKEVGMNTRFIELAGEINTSMPDYVLQKTINALNKNGKSVNGSNIILLGIAYKKNVDDLRESPAFPILSKLSDLGANLQYSDPYFDKIPPTRKYKLNLSSVSITKDTLNKSDVIILITDHDDFNYKLIEKESKLIIDTRGRFSKNKKVIKA